MMPTPNVDARVESYLREMTGRQWKPRHVGVDFGAPVFECPMCGALVTQEAVQFHNDFHVVVAKSAF